MIISCLILAILTISGVNAIDNNKTTEIINLDDTQDSTINTVDNEEIMSLETNEGFLKESNLDIYKKSIMDDDVHSTKEITFTSSKSYVISGVAEEVEDKVYLKIYYDHKNVTLGYFLKDCVYTRLATIPPNFPVNHNEFLIGLYEITEVTNANI